MKGQRKDGSVKGIKGLFQMFSSSPMNPKKYVKKPFSDTITVQLRPEEMEKLHVISCRIGAPRKSIAHHILTIGLYEAAAGCGFTLDDLGNIPEEQKNWDLTPRSMGFSLTGGEEE